MSVKPLSVIITGISIVPNNVLSFTFISIPDLSVFVIISIYGLTFLSTPLPFNLILYASLFSIL